jgi:hypothetical protein
LTASSTKPLTWYCVIGLHDFQDVSERAVLDRPNQIFDGFLRFFEILRQIAPSSKVVWMNVGQARSDHQSFRKFLAFKNFLKSTRPNYPDWLTFKDVAFDCSSSDVKDQFGHWCTGYMKKIAHRVTTCIVNKETNGNTSTNLFFQFK